MANGNNRKKTVQQWETGLNDRISKERRSDGFSTLKNARLQERGNTLQVSRIDGYQQILGDSTSFDVVYDSLVYDNDLVVYWYDTSTSEAVVTFVDIGGAGTTEKRFTATQVSYGEFTLLENNIYLTPYDKQLNNIGGTWFLNDFVSTTPTFTLSEFYEGSIQVVDGVGTDSLATGSLDVTSTTSTAGSTATASITIEGSASSDTTVTTQFYGESVDTSITNGDSATDIANKIVIDLNNNTSITDDWFVFVGLNVVEFDSRQIGSTWNGYNISLTQSPSSSFSYTLDSPTSGGEDNVLTLTFPQQPSDTVLTDTISTSDTQEDIVQKITTAINNKSGLDYTATQNTTTVNIEADNLGQSYNGTFGITQEGLDFTYNESDFSGGYEATGNFFTISFGTTQVSDIDTQTFNSGDSNTQLAQYIYDALVGDSNFTDTYNIELDGDTVTITGGTSSTLSVTEDISANNTTVNTTDIQGGDSTLDTLTYYWYKLRFVYYDGHKTMTSYPKFTKTSSPSHEILIDDINHQTDLDGNLTDIEVFRKKEGNDWFLIERVTPDSGGYFYTDDGKVNLQPLDERNYVWSRSPLTQDIARDRLVRANLEYQNKELGWGEGDVDFGTITFNVNDPLLPRNTQISIFGQGRFNDGTVSPHKHLGSVTTTDLDQQLSTNPQTQPSNVSDLKEVAYYGKVKAEPTDNLTFNSLEIYNSSIPSLATKYESDADQDRPVNPHVFLGYKYVQIFEELSGGGDSTKDVRVYDQDWNYDGTDYVGTDDSSNVTDDRWESGQLSSGPLWFDDAPDTIQIDNGTLSDDFLGSTTLTYKLKYSFPISGVQASHVYELSWVEPLKQAISEGKVSLSLESVLNGETLSSNFSNSDYLDNEVDVVGMLDTSASGQEAYEDSEGSGGQIYPTGKNHVYLILDSDSIYGDVNNDQIRNDGVLSDYDSSSIDSVEATLQFDLIGLEEKDFGGSTSEQSFGSNTTEYEVDYGLVEFSPVSEDQDEIIFLGTQKDFDEDNVVTYGDYFNGYRTTKENLFEYQTLLEASIFESIISDEDLQQFQQDYPNQLAWGGSYILESNASGTRDFEFTNFKNISQDYGEIVAISYINSILLVFCERGVNRINIGEVLTQQSDSQVFVDSSALLNNDQWILKNLPDVKPRSIVQYENMLFFSDGKDVWQFADGLQNVSNGKITLDIDEDFVGAIDPKNKEYQLTNGDETWVYSIELQQWQGPFTYKIETASAYRDNFYGIVGDDSVEFNSGNDFDGSSYDTVIESVANNLDDASVTKLFRKFYIETEKDATFSYGKEYGTWTDKTLSNYPDKNGVTHIGVNPSNKNGRQLYWKVTTQQQDFILRLVSFLWSARTRR